MSEMNSSTSVAKSSPRIGNKVKSKSASTYTAEKIRDIMRKAFEGEYPEINYANVMNVNDDTDDGNVDSGKSIRSDVSEETKRRKIANKAADALFAASFLLPLATGPRAIVRSMAPPNDPYGPSSSVELMRTMMNKRGGANRNLDSGPINFPARNRKKKPHREKLKEDKASIRKMNISKEDLLKLLLLKLVNEKKRKNSLLTRGYIGEAKTPAWTRKEGKSPTGGLNREGIRSYRKANPGSKLSMAVTIKPSKLKKGSKAWNRRKSFCSRMTGMPGAMYKNGKPTRKKLSLDKWNC